MKRNFVIVAVIAVVMSACIDGIPDNPFLELPAKPKKYIVEKEKEILHAAVPQITAHPQDAEYVLNAPAAALTVSAEADDDGTLSYQWYRDDVVINNATDASYTPPTGAIGTAYYYVTVTNTISDNGDGGVKAASVSSDTAAIAVVEKVNAAAPLISDHPQDAVYSRNIAAIALEVIASASGGGSLSYQWYRDNVAIPGATAATYTPPTTTEGTAQYYVIVTNTIADNGDGGNKTATARSETARVEVNNYVNAAIPVMSHPTGAEYTYGDTTATAALTVIALVGDSGALSYQWYSNEINSNEGGTLIDGAAGASYTPPVGGNAGTARYYYVVVTNTIADNGDGGNKSASIRSNTAAISVAPKPVTLTLTVNNKTYDRTTNATVATRTIEGNLDGTNLTADGAAAFTDANAGTGKTVTFSGWTLGGTAAGNYTLAAQPANAMANISPKPLTLTIPSGPALSPLDTSVTVTLSGIVAPDTATLSIVNTTLPTGLYLNSSTGTLTYNGTAAFINPAVPLNLSASAGSNYVAATGTMNVYVYDGQANYTGASGTYDRRIPVNSANITRANNGFNAYARTTNGLTRHYKLTGNVTLTPPATGENNWTPIGSSGYMADEINTFIGSFNGQGYTITNLTTTQGMFGHIGNSSIVTNIGLVGGRVVGSYGFNMNSSNSGGGGGGVVGYNEGTVQNCYSTGRVSGPNYVGGVVGRNEGTVQNCYSTGDVYGAYHYVGGVVGNNRGGTVQNCYSTGNVSSGDDRSGYGYVGGVIGYNNSSNTVQNCYATGNVTSASDYAGGVIGYNSGNTVQNCYATGNVTGGSTSANVGGVVGYNDTNKTVQYCYATGTVTGYDQVGGVVGENRGTVANCYATGSVNGGRSFIGGVVGYSYSGSISYCYATGTVTGANSVGGVVGNIRAGTITNCLALNPSVRSTSTSSSTVGRFSSSSIISLGPVTHGVYARNNMTLYYRWNGTGGTQVTGNGIGEPGVNVAPGTAATQYNSQTFYTTASRWYNSAIWNFTTIWQWGSNNLPILRSMPGNPAQNHTVQ